MDSPPLHEHQRQPEPEGWGPVIAIIIIVVLIVAAGIYFYASKGHENLQPAAAGAARV